MKNIKILMAVSIGLLTYSCTDDDDATPAVPITQNEEEVITTVDLTFTDSLTSSSSTFSFNDPDGDGADDPTIDTIKLSVGKVYTVSAEFKDASDPDDVEDITAEIKTEDDEHLVCFDQTNINGLTIRRTDTDGTYEVGLDSRWQTTMNATSNQGVLRLTLRHQPGSKDGSCTAGDTDVEIDFPVIIQ